MRKHHYALLALAALLIGCIIALSPKIATVANEASTELYGIDILGLTRNAKQLPHSIFLHIEDITARVGCSWGSDDHAFRRSQRDQ